MRNSLIRYALMLVTLSVSKISYAQDYSQQWWYDVEVIIFKRDVLTETIQEQFNSTLQNFAGKADMDLLSSHLDTSSQFWHNVINECALIEAAEIPTLVDINSIRESIQLEQQAIVNEVEQSQSTEIIEPELPFLQTKPVDTYEINEEVDNRLREALSIDVFSLERQINDVDESQHAQPPLPNYTKLPCIDSTQIGLTPKLTPNLADLVKEVPININAVEFPFSGSPYLLNQESLKLNQLYKDLKKRILTRTRKPANQYLMHVAWRQEVLFGQNKAKSMRLFAGKNYAKEYALNGQPINLENNVSESKTLTLSERLENLLKPIEPQYLDLESTNESSEQSDLVSRIKQALESNERPEMSIVIDDDLKTSDQLWELDGLFKVYLKYIGGTPYLHIDSNLHYRLPVAKRASSNDSAASQIILQDYPFSQLRRIISQEIHYFDHPMFGMVVQLRRYRPPAPAP